MKKPFYTPRNLLVASVTTLSLMAFNTGALAAAYQLSREYNAVEVGNGGAGGAAIANDASTAYANPAGLVRIPNKQIVLSGDVAFTYAKFIGANTWSSPGHPLPPFTQTGSARTNDTAFIPAFYYAMPLNYFGLPENKWNFGFGVNVPYGLSTDYPNNSVVRYSATISKLQVIDISPDIAYRVNDQLSLGAGIDFDRVGVDFRKIIGNPDASLGLDSLSKNTANGWGYGGHGGFLYEFTKQTRIGLAIHTKVTASVSGNSTLSGPLVFAYHVPTSQISLHTLRTRLTFPASATLSLHHEFTSKVGIDASAYYSHWGSLSGVQTIYNLAGLPPTTPTTVVIPQHYRNTWLLALGGSYQFTPSWLVRAGINYDQSPVNSSERNVTLPDTNRVGLSIGAHYDVNKQIGFDAGWMHLFFNNAPVSVPLVVGAQTSTSAGNYSSAHADVLALQMNWNIV